jgi:hypothetical protein
MASRASTTNATGSIDVQKLVNGALKLEVKLLNAGVDTMRVYLNQAARFSNLASETLQAVQDDKATLAGTAKKLTDFGRQNVQTFAELSQRLGASYYDALDRLSNGVLTSGKARAASALQAAAVAVQPAAKTAARPTTKPARASRRKAAKRA